MDSKLMNACATLLGPQAAQTEQSLLRQLSIPMVRSAFHRMALQTHPDAASRYGSGNAAVDGSRFIEASRAYETIMAYLRSQNTAGAGVHVDRQSMGYPFSEPPRRPTTRVYPGQAGAAGASRAYSWRQQAGAKPGSARTAEYYYRGPVPHHRLRLAEFMYYSGRIPWQSLIGALVWQRRERPKFGQIATEFHSLTAPQLAFVLTSRQSNEHTGEAAHRLQLLSSDEVARILRLQRARQKPIGRYFIEQGRMTEADLVTVLRDLYRHNVRYRGAR